MKILPALFASIAITTYAQIENTELLEFNNASTVIGDEGVFFTRNSLGLAGYEIPKGTGKTTIYSGSIWIGAEDINGEFYVSGSTYEATSLNSQFHSGPIADQSLYASQSYQNQYSESIWKISQQEIEYHVQHFDQAGYVAPSSILDWPGNGDVSLGVAQQLAPYIDVNNDGIYSPMDGDYPDIRGSEAVYVILNDKSYNPDYNALGIEVHLMFYQYNNGNYIGNTTFLHTRVFNRSTTDYYKFREGLYLDFDIGNYMDDYIGCDSSNHVVFAYNGDDLDEPNGGNVGYGANPPCQGVVPLSHELNTFGYYNNSGAYPYTDYQSTDTVMWNFMNAKWGDGSPWVYGGLGYDTTGISVPTNYLFNGNPYTNTGWTEMNLWNGSANPTGDRRGVMTIAEDEFLSGTSICADFAFIYDKSNTHLQNVQNVINIAASLRQLYDYQFDFPCNSQNFNGISELEGSSIRLYPNPSSGIVTIDFDNNYRKSITILDVSGKILESFITEKDSMLLDLTGRSGVYFIAVTSDRGTLVEKLIVE